MGNPLTALLWFALVLALIPLALWALKRGQWLPGLRPQADSPRLVASLSLSPHQRVVVIDIDEPGLSRRLVLGVTAQHIQTLHQFTAAPGTAQAEAELPALTEAMATTEAAPPSFAQQVRQAVAALKSPTSTAP